MSPHPLPLPAVPGSSRKAFCPRQCFPASTLLTLSSPLQPRWKSLPFHLNYRPIRLPQKEAAVTRFLRPRLSKASTPARALPGEIPHSGVTSHAAGFAGGWEIALVVNFALLSLQRRPLFWPWIRDYRPQPGVSHERPALAQSWGRAWAVSSAATSWPRAAQVVVSPRHPHRVPARPPLKGVPQGVILGPWQAWAETPGGSDPSCRGYQNSPCPPGLGVPSPGAGAPYSWGEEATSVAFWISFSHQAHLVLL